ncbi:MAG: ribonuclease HII, partial [Proteobacteria bacterium]|nr:ribonuclease HII [Pseudomonadota bacterium]
AIILPEDIQNELLNDSKKLNEKNRDTLHVIIEKEALAWAVGIVDHQKIDEINILNASYLAMHLAIDQLSISPELLLIDGNRFNPYKSIPHHCIIKGDGKYMSIAAASILAKTHRDEYMRTLHEKYPQYNWKQNKGYPTLAHRKAIRANGVSPYHRLSFNLNEQMKMEF